jgi:mediator of RNA polymerase II transcription subunit 5
MKEDWHLRNMACAIVRKPSAINTIGMFIKPATFLGPFCNLLDDWKWDEIQGESTPVYDVFGILLLLILAFKQRLCLSDSDLGIQQKDGFLAKYLASGHAEKEKLSEVERNQLCDWIKGIYVDEGLSDEVTTNCSAQDFYLLIPTLLRQSLLAVSQGRLTSETLEGGLECE